MKKSEIMRQYDFNATTVFLAVSIALAANAVLTYLLSALSFSNVLGYICRFFAVAFTVFAYVMTIRGFSKVDKSCRLSEENVNYYMGRNLKRLSVISLVLTVVVGLAVLIFYSILSQYASAGTLAPNEIEAANNVKIITAFLLMVYQIVAISTPYIVYLRNIHKITPKTDSINNFALLTMIVLVVQLAIGMLNSYYTIKGGETAFLASFSAILLIIKYVVLMLFFIKRRKSLASAAETENQETEK